MNDNNTKNIVFEVACHNFLTLPKIRPPGILSKNWSRHENDRLEKRKSKFIILNLNLRQKKLKLLTLI